MEYWSEEYIAKHDVSDGESLVIQGYPAAKGSSLRIDTKTMRGV